MDFILSGLLDVEKVNVQQYASNKELWDELQNMYKQGCLFVTMEEKLADQECEDDKKGKPWEGEPVFKASKQTKSIQNKSNQISLDKLHEV